MDIVYYPDMYVPEDTLKILILLWGKVRSIVPPSIVKYNEAYLKGEIRQEINYPLEMYKKILHESGEPIVGFLAIEDSERVSASERMFDLVTHWNKDSRFYNALKINSIDDLMGKQVEWYWFLHEKLEQPLVELLLEERLVVNWAPGEMVGFQQVGKSYMSIIAEEIKRKRSLRLITDDGFYVAARSGLGLDRLSAKQQPEDTYQLVSLAIPQVFINPRVLRTLSWKNILKIRRDLLPYAENYYAELERYQKTINSLQLRGKDDEALQKFCELCERVAISFRPLSKEMSKILRLTKSTETISFITGVMLPTIKLIAPNVDLGRVCDIASISILASKYALLSIRPLAGFEYLENLSRRLQIERMKGLATCLLPKAIKGTSSKTYPLLRGTNKQV